MAHQRPRLTTVYAAATLAVFCGLAVAVALVARMVDVPSSTRNLLLIAIVGVIAGIVAAVAAAMEATRGAFRQPIYTNEIADLREQIQHVASMLRDREPESDEHHPDAIRAKLADVSQGLAQNQLGLSQTQEMIQQVMSKLDALRSVATSPSPAADALEREADDSDVFPIVDVNEPDPVQAAAGFARSYGDPADRQQPMAPAFTFRATPTAMAEQFDSIDKARARVEDLMALSNWEAALAIASEFAHQHPDDTDAQWLQQRVNREFEIYREGSVRRLYDQIKDELERKHYRRALSIGRRLLDKFPDNKKAQKIRNQLPTILENAEIEERQEEEVRIQSFIKSKRFSDAIELGEALLAKYPMSPQASSLEEMLPRLRELAIEQEADLLGRR